jgi:hypothetical protein
MEHDTDQQFDPAKAREQPAKEHIGLRSNPRSATTAAAFSIWYRLSRANNLYPLVLRAREFKSSRIHH